MGSDAPGIDPSSVVVVGRDQVSTDLGEEILVLHLPTGGYYSLRKVAARIWRLMASPVRVSAIGETVAREYGISYERSEQDVRELLEDLAARDLVSVRAGGGA